MPGCKSRDDIAKEGSENLMEYFRDKFGPEESLDFINAREEFMKSLAGYAVASYLLQIKDRHNGNILLDSDGHLVHIDFGFILSISPAGNMRFERPDFKLTKEMIDLLGGHRSEHFKRFKDMYCRGILLLREYADEIYLMLDILKSAGLACYRPKTM